MSMSGPLARADIELVLCQAGGHRCALEAAWVRGAGSAQAADAVTLEECLGLSAEPGIAAASERQVLMLRGPAGDWRLNVAGPVELGRLAVERIFPLPPLLAARPAVPALCALALLPELGSAPAGDVLLLLLDVRALLPPSKDAGAMSELIRTPR